MTISASAGTIEIDGLALDGADRLAGEPPATPISSRSMASFCGPVNTTTGAAPITMAIGIGSLRSRYLSQCRKPPAPVASRATMRTASRSAALSAAR